jgi:hypothetical protein
LVLSDPAVSCRDLAAGWPLRRGEAAVPACVSRAPSNDWSYYRLANHKSRGDTPSRPVPLVFRRTTIPGSRRDNFARGSGLQSVIPTAQAIRRRRPRLPLTLFSALFLQGRCRHHPRRRDDQAGGSAWSVRRPPGTASSRLIRTPLEWRRLGSQPDLDEQGHVAMTSCLLHAPKHRPASPTNMLCS